MKLAQLFSDYKKIKWGAIEQNNHSKEVVKLCSDSRKTNKGDVYIAIKGTLSDGHDFLPEVCEKEVLAIVVEDESKVPVEFKGSILKVECSRKAQGCLAAKFYGAPADGMFCIGITGTNGKTTITYMVEDIFNSFNWTAGVIGTVDHHLKDKVWNTDLTTPDNLTFHRRLSEFSALSCKAVAIETSSIALEQNRVAGVSFDAGIFTNITRDHLDYHKSMEEYLSCKELLFSEVLESSNKEPRFAILNFDDENSKKIKVSDGIRVLTYGLVDNSGGQVSKLDKQNKADFQFEIKEKNYEGMLLEVKSSYGQEEFFLPMIGGFNAYNTAAAILSGLVAGISLEACCLAMSNFKGVPGRVQKVINDYGYNVFVDYAHTPDAMKNILMEFVKYRNEINPKGRIITVFGCGGDRDFGKRSMMGELAVQYSNEVIVTSDNPRSEDPKKILENILVGVNKYKIENPDNLSNVQIEVDRKIAISKSLELIGKDHIKDDMVLILGKGHENYQTIGDKKTFFSDEEVARNVIECIKHKKTKK